MISQGDVHARVVDITRKHPVPERIAVDAQVLYFVYYPNFRFFASAGMNLPIQYSHGKYDAYLESLRKAQLPPKSPDGASRAVRIVTAGNIIGEFARVMEYAEIEILWRTDPNNPHKDDFNPKICKEARYQYAADLPLIRENVETIVTSTRQLLDVLPKPGSEEKELSECLVSWKNSLGDFADATLVTRASSAGIYDILSDDADLATFPGITLYTADPTTIRAATDAGKCLNPRPSS